MENPFEKRATEHVRDNVAFLALVAPDPVTYYIVPAAQKEYMYDRLVVIRGTPGSGKTTLARLFEYSSLDALLRLTGNDEFRDVTAALTSCYALKEGEPCIIGCRLPLESDYRDFWEFPYPVQLKMGLMTALLQARSVLGWLRHLRLVGIQEGNVSVVPRGDAESSIDAIGGLGGNGLLDRARSVESAVYNVVSALVPPPASELDINAVGPYHPFDVIERFLVTKNNGHKVELRPLAIFDDAHELQRDQYEELHKWLARRELRVSRWVLTRLDVLTPDEALEAAGKDGTTEYVAPGLTAGRDHVNIMLQGSGPRNRPRQRRLFRKMAKEMGNRYLRRMTLFLERGHSALASLLSTDIPPVSSATIDQFEQQTTALRERLKITQERRDQLEADVDAYLKGASFSSRTRSKLEDVRYTMLQILMHRYTRRVKGPVLFDESDPDPSRPLKVDADLFDKACVQLLHARKRPYYYSFEKLCDAATENAELFLHLAGALVERSATQIIRSEDPLLTAKTQHQLLCERVDQIMSDWNFPYHLEVRRLLEQIAIRCRDISLEANAWLAPNAYGILQEEFDEIAKTHEQLARVLQYAVAYNAITLHSQRQCKQSTWCIVEVGGLGIIKYGLSLKRGDFIEGNVNNLAAFLGKD